MPSSTIPEETMKAWERPLRGSKLQTMGRIQGGMVDGATYSSARAVADALINSRPRGAGGGISKSNPADPVDMAQVEHKEAVEAMTEDMRLRDQRKDDRADARMDSGEIEVIIDGRRCRQVDGAWLDEQGNPCVGAA